MQKSKRQPATAQKQKFIEAARELGCDEDEGRFKERLKKLTSAPPPDTVAKRKEKKSER